MNLANATIDKINYTDIIAFVCAFKNWTVPESPRIVTIVPQNPETSTSGLTGINFYRFV